MNAAHQVLNDYNSHYFHEKWVECKLSYPKDQLNQSNQEITYNKQTGSKSNKPGSSPFGSQDDQILADRQEPYHGYYTNGKGYEHYQKGPLRLSPQRADQEENHVPYGHYMPQPVYSPPYQYTMPRAQLMGYQQLPSPKGYPFAGPHYGYPQQNNRTSPEIYRNLNNEIATKPINPKLKTGSQAVGSCPSDMHLVTGSDDARRMFQLSRGYSNYLTDFAPPKAEQTIIPQRRVLNRIGTCDFAYSKEETNGNTPEQTAGLNHARQMFQNNKSSSLHPDDFHRIEYRAANLSPSRIKLAPNTELSHMNSLFFSSGVMRPEPSNKPKIKIQQPVDTPKQDKKDTITEGM
jgi:hypothetical protein